jgi:hypothetical protein
MCAGPPGIGCGSHAATGPAAPDRAPGPRPGRPSSHPPRCTCPSTSSPARGRAAPRICTSSSRPPAAARRGRGTPSSRASPRPSAASRAATGSATPTRRRSCRRRGSACSGPSTASRSPTRSVAGWPPPPAGSACGSSPRAAARSPSRRPRRSPTRAGRTWRTRRPRRSAAGRCATRSPACASPARARRLLLCDPPLSYEEVSRRLGMPVGSIGPTRLRFISSLRRDERLAAALAG